MTRTRAFYVIPLLIGCLIEAVGFGARIASGIEAPNFTLGPYIVQALLILITPALLAATVYMILGYIILAANGETHSMICKKFLTKLFVCGDFFSFMIQSSGKFTSSCQPQVRFILAFLPDLTFFQNIFMSLSCHYYIFFKPTLLTSHRCWTAYQE